MINIVEEWSSTVWEKGEKVQRFKGKEVKRFLMNDLRTVRCSYVVILEMSPLRLLFGRHDKLAQFVSIRP